ncbi:MAG TPA: DUF4037 domain-containing protein [Thermomicrobiales bacterium]|nr:DUF4037 domain-containing protein [Thermomicrobiales bacterium]
MTQATPDFVPGLELSRLYATEVVEPILRAAFPALPLALGLLGEGSDVLGFDTDRSMDHDWGPRCVVFVPDDVRESLAPWLDQALRDQLPRAFLGFPTGVDYHPDGATFMAGSDANAPFVHRVHITSPAQILHDLIDIRSLDDLTPALWVTTPQQKLLELTAGAIFRDDTGEITRIRRALAWYPDDVWRLMLAGTWKAISQLEPFVGRCGEVGDDLGSQLVAMRLIRDQMRLAFLLERRYAPYQKWFGTAFDRLAVAPALTPSMDKARYARGWQERERGIVAASVVLANRQNAAKLAAWVDPAPRPFWSRPFQVLQAERFTEALAEAIADPAVKALPADLGGLDTWVDSTDAAGEKGLHRAVQAWLETRG